MEGHKLQGDAAADKWTKCWMFFLILMKKNGNEEQHFLNFTQNQGQSINLVTKRRRSLNFKFSISPLIG